MSHFIVLSQCFLFFSARWTVVFAIATPMHLQLHRSRIFWLCDLMQTFHQKFLRFALSSLFFCHSLNGFRSNIFYRVSLPISCGFFFSLSWAAEHTRKREIGTRYSIMLEHWFSSIFLVLFFHSFSSRLSVHSVCVDKFPQLLSCQYFLPLLMTKTLVIFAAIWLCPTPPHSIQREYALKLFPSSRPNFPLLWIERLWI